MIPTIKVGILSACALLVVDLLKVGVYEVLYAGRVEVLPVLF